MQQHSTSVTTVQHPSLSQSQQQQQQTSSKTEHLIMNGPSSAGASSVSIPLIPHNIKATLVYSKLSQKFMDIFYTIL